MKEVEVLLGPKRGWRGYPKGRLERVVTRQNAQGEPVIEWKVVPSRFKAIVTDDVAKGLEAESKEWSAANSKHQPEGDVRRMLKVASVRDASPDAAAEATTGLMTPLEVMVQRAAAAGVQEFGKAMAKIVAESNSQMVKAFADAIATLVDGRKRTN